MCCEDDWDDWDDDEVLIAAERERDEDIHETAFELICRWAQRVDFDTPRDQLRRLPFYICPALDGYYLNVSRWSVAAPEDFIPKVVKLTMAHMRQCHKDDHQSLLLLSEATRVVRLAGPATRYA